MIALSTCFTPCSKSVCVFSALFSIWSKTCPCSSTIICMSSNNWASSCAMNRVSSCSVKSSTCCYFTKMVFWIRLISSCLVWTSDNTALAWPDLLFCINYSRRIRDVSAPDKRERHVYYFTLWAKIWFCWSESMIASTSSAVTSWLTMQCVGKGTI